VATGNGTEVELDALFHCVAAHRLDTQKKSWCYSEGRDAERQAFLVQLAQLKVADRVYIDEAGVDDTLSYAYGWSRQGERCRGERLGHRTQRVSMAAAWCQGENGHGQVLAPLTFEGYCDSALVEAWFETQLCPVLRAGQVVILDNASFHRHERLRQLLAAVGCSLLPLPSYSPDLNKIEPLWNSL
jgi:DDE superfamily endonuclease